MVAGADGAHATLALLRRQRRQEVVGPAELERAAALEALALEAHRPAGASVEGPRGHHRRAVRDAVEPPRGGAHLVERQGGHARMVSWTRMSPVRQGVTVVGRRLEPEHHRLRDFLTRVAQPYEWVEAGTPEADARLAERGLAAPDLPLVIAEDGDVARATVERLADAWHESDPPRKDHYDLAIVGAGPAGLAAAVYAASDGLSTLLIERDVPGGQASHTSRIENFFGFPDGIGGAELARSAGRQAEGFGAELVLLRGVTGSRMSADGTEIELAGDHRVTADVVIASPGMDWRRLEVDGVEAGLGRGVYYGAGRSEAARCG